MSPTAAIPSQTPSVFEVVARRTFERPARALIGDDLVEALAEALVNAPDPSSTAEPVTARRAAPRVDVRA
jgi:hypothetical protein